MAETTQVPITFCTPLRQGSYIVRMPWGIPPLTGKDPFDLAGLLGVFLAALSPFLNIVACFFKLIAFIKAVPNVPKMVSALIDLTECFSVTIPSYALVVPTAVIQMIQFVYDMLVLILGILQNVQVMIGTLNQGEINIDLWTTAGDPASLANILCQRPKQDQLLADINIKMTGVQGLITILNILLVLVGQSPITVTSYDPTAINDIITVIQDTLDILGAIPGIPPSG